jgi:hypothetical protein
MTSLTRGPLPASVYWRRRLGVLFLGLALLLLVMKLVGGDGSEPNPGGGVATQVSGESTEEPGDDATSDSEPKQKKKQKKTQEPQEPVLAQPDGPCTDSDILITPSVEEAVAGRPVAVTLELRTAEAEACTWRVSANHVTMKITSGSDLIWTSQQCRKAVPVQDVVVRRDVTTFVEVPWNARRSDDGCPVQTDWADIGTYHVYAAALGGEPAEARFELERPSPEVITTPDKPKQNKQDKRDQQGDQDDQGGATEPPKIR